MTITLFICSMQLRFLITLEWRYILVNSNYVWKYLFVIVTYRKILLIRLSIYTNKRKFDGPIFGRCLCAGCGGRGRREALISAFFISCKVSNIFKANNKDTRIPKVNGKAKNKDTVGVVLASFLLILNIFHFMLQRFDCRLSSLIS